MKTVIIKEEWRPIKGYESYYEVSNFGQIRSINRTILTKSCCGYEFYIRKKGIILKPANHPCGYLVVALCKNGKSKNFLIHRLVAEAFIPNPNNKETVNHKNEIKTDNRVENLEWATLNENLHYGTGIVRGHANRDRQWHRIHHGGLNPYAKPVKQSTLQGDIIKEWACIADAVRELKISYSSICAAAKGKRKFAGGFKWQYINQ